MDYCAPHGIPYGDFLEWSQLSRDAALAWQARESAKCGGCGQVRAEWMTVDTDGHEVEAVPAPFLVDDHWCPACDALARHRRARGDTTPDGVHDVFRPNDAAADASDLGDED